MPEKSPHRPLIVGIGGTAAARSSTEQALALALSSSERQGAGTRLFGSAQLLALPH
jgi:FMN reductase